MVVACPELLYMYVQKFLQFVAIFSFVKFNLHACITLDINLMESCLSFYLEVER